MRVQPPQARSSLDRGVGSAIALKPTQRGAKVAAHFLIGISLAAEVIHKTKCLRNGPDVTASEANVENAEEIAKLMDSAVAHFGGLEICCSNAGMHSSGHFTGSSATDFDRNAT
ncbi:hypothetical protein ACJQWK_02901 [Exserohilum turcicum]